MISQTVHGVDHVFAGCGHAVQKHTAHIKSRLLVTQNQEKQDSHSPQTSSNSLNATADPERSGAFGSLKCEQVPYQ